MYEGAGGGAIVVVVAVACVRIGPSGTELYWWWTNDAAGADNAQRARVRQRIFVQLTESNSF